MFRIAIIGGGIGGLVTALSLHHHCQSANIQIDIYEQANEYKEIGAGVGLGPNASRLIEKLGLVEEMRRIAGKRNHIWFTFRRYDTGAEVLRIEVPEQDRRLHLPMHRADLLDLLVRETQRRSAAVLHTKKQCRKLEDQGDSVLVTFADGSSTSANLVVGADGIHSVVRSHYVRDSPQYGGMVIYRGLCPISEIQADWKLPTYSTIWMAQGKHFLTFPINDDKTMNIVAFVTTPKEQLGADDARESWTRTVDKDSVQREFKDFAAPVQNIMRHMDTNPLKWILYDREGIPQWSFAAGKIVLLGDAAHSMCPHQGAGAGQAIEDAYVLGRALQDYLRARSTAHARAHSLDEAMQVYQSVRAPRAEKVQLTSRQAGDLYQLQVAEVDGLSYEDRLDVVKGMIENRMKWIWSEDIDQAYERARQQRGLERL